MLSHTHFYLKIIKLSNHYPKMKGHPELGCPFGNVFVVIFVVLNHGYYRRNGADRGRG